MRAAAGIVVEDNVFSETEGLVADLFPITVVISIAGQSFDAEEDITGDIVIRRNIIDGANALFSDGISLLSTNARIYVANNHISGVNVAFRNEIYRRPAYITGNDFMGGVTGFGFFSAGIEIGCGVGSEARATIRGNYIAAEDPEAIGFAVGISIFGGDLAAWSSDVPDADCPFRKSSIVGNDIIVSNGFDAIEFYAFAASRGRILDNVIARNTVRGTAINGIILENFDFLGTSPDVEISKNRIVDNDLTGLSVEEAHVFLGESTTGNFVVIEEGDIVADFGANNRIIRR